MVDGNGAAVPGAGVWFWGASGRLDVPVAQPGTMVGTTDAQGELRLLGLPNLRGHGCWVAASHDALGTSAARMVAAPANESDQATRIVELQLGLVGAFLELRVTDAAGSPIAGALAEARPVDQPGSRADAAGRSLTHLLRAGTTGTNGTVRLGPLPPCDYVLQVRAPGCERHGEPFTVGGAQPLQRTVVLEREARVHGRVVSPDGEALPGADVAIQVEPRGGNARSGPDGTFQLGELSPGDATAVASLADHASGETKVKLARGEDAMVALTLTPLSRCHGRLLDEAGRALAGWGVRIAPRGVSDAVSRAAVTAADGTFSLAARGDVDHDVSVCEPGRHLPLPLPGATLRPRPEPWDLRVPDAARSTAWIAGTLVDRDDRAAITDQTLAVKGAHFTAWPGNTMEAAVTDPRTGSFRLGPLPPGRYELFLRGRNAVHFSVPDLVLQPHQTTDLGRIVVPASGVVAVELSAEPGLRLADVHMELEGGRSSDVVAIDVGTLRGEQRVLPGTYRVTIYGAGFRWLHQSLDVLPDATATVRGTLRAAVRVGLRVHRPPGE
ncbi:MAG: carboxypeptidase-like regulatory domain-containing protein, partial [Planctomycetota bacterium]